MAIDFQPDFDFQPDDEQPIAEIPGNERTWKETLARREEVKKKRKNNDMFLKDYAVGLGEAGLGTLVGGLGMFVAPIQGMANAIRKGTNPTEEANKVVERYSYQPKTDVGEELLTNIGEFANYNLLPLAGMHFPISVRPSLPKVPKESITERIKPVEAAKANIDFVPEVNAPELRLEHPIAAENRVKALNMRERTAEDFNNMDANVRAVQEEIRAKELADAQEAMLAEQARLAELDNWRNNAKQDSIVEDFGNNDPIARMPEMRIDENGIPIRSDLSMEAQNLQNPLQRNLWGDELPVRTGDGGIPLTQAIDQMSRGPAREQAISNLRGYVEEPRIKRIENSVGTPEDIARFEGEGGGLGRSQRGAIDPDLLTLGFNKLFHGGKEFKKWDPKTVGKGEGMAALGPGLYAGDNPELAGIYKKYGNDIFYDDAGNIHVKPGVLNELAVDTKNILDYRADSPKWNQARENLTKAGLRGDLGIQTALMRAAEWKQGDVARKAMIDAGIDGMYVQLGGKLGKEIVIFNPDVIAQVSRADTPIEKYTGNKFNQRGGLNIQDIADTVSKALSKAGTKIGDVLTPKERLIIDNLGDNKYIPRGDEPAKIIENALKESDGPKLFENMQSGLDVAAKKTNSSLMQGVSRWLAWAEKSANKSFRDFVQPMERVYKALNISELGDLHDLMKAEMFDRARYTEQQLRDAGLSERGIKAYNQLRETFDNALQTINEARLALGQEPITPAEAYLSSQWRGNWHMPVKDAKGNLVWYIKVQSRAEAVKAQKWFKENHPDYTLANPEYKPSDSAYNVPKDVTDIYTRMMDVFQGTPIADELSMLMNQYKQEKDFSAGNFKVHFENKANIRGFMGDRPWLSDKENARQGAKAQIEYLKDAYRWAPMNEALSKVKEVLNNPELNTQQPNNMSIAKLYTANAMGITNNMFKNLENFVAQRTGQSPSTFREFVGDLKTWTYLTQLGMSTGYAIATPAQALVLGPALHQQLSGRGFKHNPLMSMVKAASDTAKILATHEGYNLTGAMKDYKLSELGKEALRYAEDNGIVSVSLFDEAADLGAHPVTQGVKDVLGFTISLPEKVARTSTFMSFVHHLDASGQFANDRPSMFRLAEELTDQTLTKFSRSGRPLIVDRAGLVGELGYTYKSPIFNYYNNLAALAQEGRRTGNWRPLLAALGMTVAMGGLINTPGLQEMESVFGLFKDAVAKHMPQYTKTLEELSPRNLIVSNLPEIAAYGAISAATGTQMATRFSTQVLDPANPMGEIFPAAGTIENVAGLVKPLISPNETNVAQAAYSNLPPAGKGLLETKMDTFKTGPRGEDGRQGYYNPNRLGERDRMYNRTERDETVRKFGLTSLEEAKAKDIRFANSKENKRFDTARRASMTKMFDAIVRGDKEDIDKYAESYFDNYGDDQSFKSDFNRALEGSMYTPEQREIIKANTRKEIEAILRRFKMEGK